MQTIIFGGNGFVGKNLRKFLSPDYLYLSSKDCDLLKSYQHVYQFLSERLSGDDRLEVVNLAGRVAGCVFNRKNQSYMLRQNSQMTLNLCGAISAIAPSLKEIYFLNVSSVCAYQDGVQDEDSIFVGKPNLNNRGYGLAKRVSLMASECLEIDHKNIKVANLIPTNMFGPEDDFNEETSHFIPNIIRQLVNNEPVVEILGNCRNLRDFLYVEDFCRIIKTFLDNEYTGTYNVSTGRRASVEHTAKLIKSYTNSNSQLKFSTNGPFEARQTNNRKLLDKIGDFDFTDLLSGLAQTIDWYNANKKHIGTSSNCR